VNSLAFSKTIQGASSLRTIARYVTIPHNYNTSFVARCRVCFRKVTASRKDDAIDIREKDNIRRCPFGKKGRKTLKHDSFFRLTIEVGYLRKILESFGLGNNMWNVQLGDPINEHLSRCGAEGKRVAVPNNQIFP
jgi:hypothetical protein